MIYVGGSFDEAGSDSDIQYLARWDGASWFKVGDGVDNVVWALLPYDGLLYVGGYFTEAGGMSIADRVAIWNGSAWSPLDLDLPGVNPYTYALAADNHRFFLGYSFHGTASVSGTAISTVTHAGSTRAFPTITITRSGGTTATLEGIRNLTIGKVLLFDHAMLDGERIVIDLTPGHKTITTYVGDSTNNALDSLLPGSDFGTFALMPGDNDIALYISETGSPTLTAHIQWQTTYPTIDGATS